MEPLEIHYHDGKPEVEKTDIAKEIDKELHKDTEPANDADIAKSSLYADLPKAKQKMDKSLNARAINSMLESFNQQRNEAVYDMIKQGDSILIKVKGYEFICSPVTGIIETLKIPDDGLYMKYTSSKLKGAKVSEFIKEIEKHLKRHKLS